MPVFGLKIRLELPKKPSFTHDFEAKMVNTENTKVYETVNQTGRPIHAEHKRRTLAAIEDFHRGRKDIPGRIREQQLELFE